MIDGFLQDGSIDDALYDQLEQAMAEARNARREAFQETVKRGKAEKDAIDAIRRVFFYILGTPLAQSSMELILFMWIGKKKILKNLKFTNML